MPKKATLYKMWTEIIVIFILSVLFTIFVIVMIKLSPSIEKTQVTPNMPIIENDYRSEYTGGYTLGNQKRVKQNKNGTKLVEFYPIDVEQGENIKRPHLQSVVVKDEFFKPFSPGELSDRRNRIKLVVRDPSRVPMKMRDTTEGKWAIKEGQLGHIQAVFGKTIQSGDEAIFESIKNHPRGNISKATLAKIKEESLSIRNIVNPPEPDKNQKT